MRTSMRSTVHGLGRQLEGHSEPGGELELVGAGAFRGHK